MANNCVYKSIFQSWNSDFKNSFQIHSLELKSLHEFIYRNLFMSRSEEVKWEKADEEPEDVNRWKEHEDTTEAHFLTAPDECLSETQTWTEKLQEETFLWMLDTYSLVATIPKCLSSHSQLELKYILVLL